MDNLQQLAAEAALRKMADSGWLDICAIDKIIKITGSTPDKRAYGILSLLHCVHFKDMDAQIRAQLPDLLAATFGGDPVDFSSVLRPQPARGSLVVVDTPKRAGWLRLLAGGGNG